LTVPNGEISQTKRYAPSHAFFQVNRHLSWNFYCLFSLLPSTQEISMKVTLTLSVLFMLFFLSSPGFTDDSYKIVFETIDCNGNTGFATEGPDEIHKMGQGDCSHPQHPGQKLKQLLIHDGSSSYKVYTLSQEEANNVMLEVKEYMRARKGMLEQSDSIIITH
jgi:hypothetical protein